MSEEKKLIRPEDAPDMELPTPSGFNEEKIADLKERKQKVMQQIDKVIGGGKIKGTAKPIFFSFYTSPEKVKREVGEHWIDEDGKEWEQRNGYSVSIPKIDRVELEKEGVLMPRFCPKCNKPLTRQLDQKMWRHNGFCMDCTAEWETEMQVNGTYKDYERSRIMANVRAFYHDVMNGLEDYINSFDATYVNEFGDVEKWDKINKPMLKSLILNDLKLLAQNFEKDFGEPLEKGDGLASNSTISTEQLV